MAEEDSSFESTLDELESLFHLATEFVRDLRDLKNEEKLKFYGLFKQVSILKCTNFEVSNVFYKYLHLFEKIID